MRDPEDLWKSQPGDFFFLATKSKAGKWTDHPIKRGDWGLIDELIEDHPQHDIYMCPHGFTRGDPDDRIRRQKDNSVDPHLLYADLDEADPRKLALKPTIAIESSPGRYVGYWVTDGPCSEELNRRLAYSFGADTSGWDRTQVLRVPGTRNFKYNPAPRVKVLWSDGPTYKASRLEKMLPADIPTAATSTDSSSIRELYHKYETHLTRWARKELLEGNPQTGKRSEILWKLQNELMEAGCSLDEMFQLLWVSPWNKFKDRHGGAEQLRRELEKNLSRRIDGKLNGDPDKPPKDAPWNPLPRSIFEVEREQIDWLVPGLLARKELTIVEGDPGVGKSYLVQVISGLICDGKQIPVLDYYKPTEGRVAYFDTENTASTVTKARLEENGVKNLDRYFQGEEAFSIDDEERWELASDRLRELKPELIVFDTINTYIGSTDTYRSSETQQAMGFFKYLATSLNCSVILLRHLTKGGNTKAIYRGQGSIAFTGAARIVATVGTIPDDENLRVVACTKNNLSKHFRSFTYTIESLPEKGGDKNRSKLVWGDQVDISSDTLISPPSGKEKESTPKGPTEKDMALEMLLQALEEEGLVHINPLLKRAHGRSISRTAMYRAAESLELKRTEARRGEFYWSRG